MIKSIRYLGRRRPKTRKLAVTLLLASAVYCYSSNKTTYTCYGQCSASGNRVINSEDFKLKSLSFVHKPMRQEKSNDDNNCPVVMKNSADIDTVETYQTFDFQVIAVPHSHNDPGWVQTFEEYFEHQTKSIIDNIVSKLTEYPNMTFIWTEVVFLNAWWESSSREKQEAFKKLTAEGRLEITSGGWVMPDEACTHFYAIIDQFIEGHQWLKNNLNITPKTGWAIDPFGHGPTVPFLLDKSGFEGVIIQRIHYSWQKWFANKQIGEFFWVPTWYTQKPSLIVKNLPSNIYSIKFTCGFHPIVCLDYDFRYARNITEKNIHIKSKFLIEEYARIGSLTPHNVVLVPIGDDFRYKDAGEFDMQYSNYMKMFNYINTHKDLFHADVKFGTLLDYFNALKERYNTIPTLKGDFFVYSDIFTEGVPAYWSGYFTTRPFNKILVRQFEHQVRVAEILFSLVSNLVKESNKTSFLASEDRLEKFYEQLVNARRILGLFQHHDAITGTSKESVMRDYGTKMLTSLSHCIRLQEIALTAVVVPESNHSILQSDAKWETYGHPPRKLQVTLLHNRKIIVFNPLAEPRTEIITINSNTTNVRIYDTSVNKHVQYQILPVFEFNKHGESLINKNKFDVSFVAFIPGLTTVTFNLEEHTNKSHHSVVYCSNCKDQRNDLFSVREIMPGEIQLENSILKLFINRTTGFLRQIYRKDIKKNNVVKIDIGAYKSAKEHSGAYLFRLDPKSPEKILRNQQGHIIITEGPLSTEIRTLYLPLLMHTVRIYNVNDDTLSSAVFIENTVDFEDPPKNNQTELFMRVNTDIQNGILPEFYTDQNGFQYQKRVKVEKLGIVANYYPITTMAWLQDERSRLTLVTNHAQGAASLKPGRLELMLDRRTMFDDGRGLHEPIVDNKRTTYQHWLLLESIYESFRIRNTNESDLGQVEERNSTSDAKITAYQLPSRSADYLSRTLNYPVNVYMLNTSELGNKEVKSNHSFVNGFPSGLQLVTLRTITQSEHNPSSSCFMVLQRPGYSCSVGMEQFRNKSYRFTLNSKFNGLIMKNLTAVSLTSLKTIKNLSSMTDIALDPMEVKTYKISF